MPRIANSSPSPQRRSLSSPPSRSPARPGPLPARLVAIALGCAAASAAAAQGPIGDWYGTMSNFGGPRMAILSGGTLSFVPAVFPHEGPIAVFGDVRTIGPNQNGPGSRYDLAGLPLGTNYTHQAGFGTAVDGATDGTYNYTVEVFTGRVHRTDRDWKNPVYLFTVAAGLGDPTPSSQGGITYDCATNTLWIAGEGSCPGECGISGAVSNYSMTGTVLSSTIFSGASRLNDLAIDVDGTFWAADSSLLRHYSASGALLGSFPINLGADTIQGAEIVPVSGCCVDLLSSFTADRSGAFPIDRMQVVALYDGNGAGAQFDIELWNPTTGACCVLTIADLENFGTKVASREYAMNGFEPTGTFTVRNVVPNGQVDGVAFGLYLRDTTGARWMLRSAAASPGRPNFVGGWPLAFSEATWDARLNEITQSGYTGFVARRQAQITLSGAQLLGNGTWRIPTGRIEGDVDGDGCVDEADVNLVEGNFGGACCD